MSHCSCRGFVVVSFMLVAIAACGDESFTAVDAGLIDAPGDAPTIDAPVTDAPTADAPDTDAPMIDAPDTDAAMLDAPMTDAPMTDAPMTDAPMTDAPATDAPATDAATDAMNIDAAPPVGDVCTTAEMITLTGGAATVNATTLAYNNDYLAGACTGTASAGPDRVHVVTVAANSRLSATVTPTAGTFDPGVFLVGGPAAQCNVVPLVCLGANDTGGSGVADTAIYNNTSNAAVDVYIIIDSFQTAAGNAYTLAVNVGAIPPTPAGDTCPLAETVTLVSGSATVVGTTATAAGYVNNYSPGAAGVNCTGYAEPGNDRVHVVNVPVGQALTATVTPTVGTFDVGIYLVGGPASACDANPLVCLDGYDEGFGGTAESVGYINTTNAAVDVYIVIDSYNAGGDAYSLQVNVATPPAGEVCQNAPATAAGTSAGTTAGYSNQYEPPVSCTGDIAPGRDRAYAVTVNNGQTLTATVTPGATFDAAIYLIGAPAGMCDAMPIVCLDGADGVFDGQPETVSYTNSLGSTTTVFVVVDSYYPSAAMDYSLNLVLAP